MVILVWSLLYVREMIAVIEEPFFDARISYTGVRGKVTVQAARLQLNVGAGSIEASGVILTDPDGTEVLRAGSLHALMPTPWTEQRSYEVTADSGYVFLERREDGTWNFDDFKMVEEPAEPMWVPVVLSVTNSAVDFVDHVATPAAAWEATVSNLSVFMFQDDVSVDIEGFIAGAGAVKGTIDVTQGAVVFANVFSPRMDVVPLRDYLASLPDIGEAPWIAGWDAEYAFYSGDLSIQRIEDRWVIRGYGGGEARGVLAGGRFIEQVAFTGSFTESVIRGDFSGTAPGITATGGGTIQFADMRGRLDGHITVANKAAIERFAPGMVPATIDFRNMRYTGTLAFGDVLAASGVAVAEAVRYGQYEATNARAEISADDEIARFENLAADLYGTSAVGEVAVIFGPTPEVRGYAVATNVDLRQVPGLPEDRFLGGSADLHALFGGSTADPFVELRASGFADVLIQTPTLTQPEVLNFGMRGRFAGGILDIYAVEFTGLIGQFHGAGSVDVLTGGLDLRLAAQDLEIGFLPESPATGTAYALLNIGGTLQDPVAEGRMEVYGVEIAEYSLPYVATDVAVRNDVVFLEDMVARSGVTLVTGDARIGLSDRIVAGSGRVLDLGLGEFSQGTVVGLAEGTWVLEGTFEDPVVHAELISDSIIVDAVEFTQVRAEGRWRDRALFIEDMEAHISGGIVRATGGWALDGPSEIALTAIDVPLRTLQPYIDPDMRLDGLLAATSSVQFFDGRIVDGSGEVLVRDMSINDEPLGSGLFEAQMRDNTITVSGGAGTIESYYFIDEAIFDFDANRLTAEFSTLDSDLSQILQLVNRALERRLTLEEREQIQRFDGNVSVVGRIEAEIVPPAEDQPGGVDVTAADLEFSGANLQYGEHELGEFSTTANLRGTVWTIQQADWVGGPGEFHLSPAHPNTIDLEGDINLGGAFTNMELGWLAVLQPALGGLTGFADMTFETRGPVDSPTIEAMVSGADVGFGEYRTELLSIGPVFVREGGITVNQGQLRVFGLQVDLTEATIPFRYPFEIPRDEELSVRVVVQDADLATLERAFGGVDPELTEGRIYGGLFTVSGTVAEPLVNGAISAEASRLKFLYVDQQLADVVATITLEQNLVSARAAGASVAGGTFEAQVNADIEDRAFLDGSFVRAQDFSFTQAVTEDVTIEATVTTNLDVAGDLYQPLVTGFVTADEALIAMAGEFLAADEARQLPVNPFFDIDLSVEEARVRRGVLNAVVSGDGTLRGPLRQFDLDMRFMVEGGEITMPTGRILLQEGGTAHLVYGHDWRGVPESSLLLDAVATTRVTAPGPFGVQRYHITLHITGDAINEDELNISATSDPPDLSRDQIFAILGQQQLIQDIAGMPFGDFEAQMRTIFSAVAVPALLTPITRGIEQALGLDYVFLDFGRQGLGGLTVARALGAGFVLEYRRVLEPYVLTGESLEEITLYYRPPFRDPLLGRLTFGLGLNNEGLLRLSLGYSIRF